MDNRILIVEDDTSFGTMLRNWAGKNGFDATLVHNMETAREQLNKHRFDIVLTDMRLPDGDGIMLLTSIKEMKSPPAVMIMTGYADVQSAVSAMKLGAADYLEKPINPTILKEKIHQALLDSSAPKSSPLREKEGEVQDAIVYGKSPEAKKMYEHIKVVAPTRLSVLITGESGTGKEYAARVIHRNSTRREGPFYAVDCGSLSKELAPSELFGHLKGSFTSAFANKKGVFELADGGTIFLDEVGNLSYDIQKQLLRALQERTIRPVGAAEDIKTDVRIIVATNENLQTAIAEGRFREDLYHRLNEFSIKVPSLRERKTDIPIFVHHFIESANAELDKSVTSISEEAMLALTEYAWPGNLRELKNVIRRAVLFADSERISIDSLPDYILYADTEFSSSNKADEKERIEAALKRAAGNKTLAAKLLGVDRKTLYNKMHHYGMEI